MPDTIQYSNNPNSDTAFVVQEGGQRNRTVLTAVPEGTLQLSDSPNVSTGYVTDEDGKKHKVNLVAEVEGDVELPENPNSTKGYVTDENGKKHRVVLTATLHGGGTPINNEDISVTTNGTYTASEGYTGLGTVSVSVPNPSTGTKSITANGVYDVTDYASADVQVPGAPTYYLEKAVDANGKLINTSNLINLNGVTDVGDYGLAYAYYKVAFPANTVVDLSGFTTVSGDGAFHYTFYFATGITSVDLSNLTTVSGGCGNMFSFCQITSVDLSSLTTVSGSCGSMFLGNQLTSIDLSNLTTIGNNGCSSMFQSNKNLATVDISKLTTIGDSGCARMFAQCQQLSRIDFSSVVTIGSNGCNGIVSSTKNGIALYFPALKTAPTNAFNSCFNGVNSGVLHVPSNITTNFSSTYGTIYRDLPATTPLHGADSQTYDRNPRFDTSSALGWRIGDTWDTPYYTSGTTSPSVGDTIYSDSACTVAVTTISSIS